MKVESFIQHLEELFDTVGYSIYFGTKGNYNTVKDVPEKVVIVEPFTLRAIREGRCEYATSLTLWVSLRRPVDTQFRTASGHKAKLIDTLLSNTNDIIAVIGTSPHILITQNIDTIPVRYFEADDNMSVNSEAFTNFVLPVKIWL